jgi:hypothetical protein
MTYDDETFTARLPNGERVTCRVKRDITNARRETFKKIFEKADRDDGDSTGTGSSDHHASKIADLMVEARSFPDRATALNYLLHSRGGQSLLRRLSKAADQPAKEEPMDTVHAIMKDAGIAATCAQIVAKGNTSITELEIIQAVSKIAVERWPQLTEAQGFAKILDAPTEEARVLNHALKIAKAAEFAVFDIGRAAYTKSDPTPNADTAYAALMRKAESYHDAHPELSVAQCFEKIYTAPANIELAKRERMESAPPR